MVAIGPSLQSLLPDQAIFNALVPREGPKMVPYIAAFNSDGANSYIIDLQQTVAQRRISVIQSVWIDASGTSSAVSVAVEGTALTLTAPAGSQGFYPALVPAVPRFTVSCETNDADVTLIFLNVPVPASVWGSAATAVTVSGTVETQTAPASAAWASYSGATANPAASTSLLPADADRVYVLIKAPETADLWVNPLGGTASIDGLDCVKIPAGATYENFPGEPVISAWTYYCATTGVNFTALAR